MRVVHTAVMINRFITTHNSHGQAIFSTELKEEGEFVPVLESPTGAVSFFLGYSTHVFPSPLTNNEDLTTYKADFKDTSTIGLVAHNGTILRYVDYPPGISSPMHRTESLDYGIVLEGQVKCVLDSGEERVMKKGDVTIQRGTMHMWVNESKTEWARMVYVLTYATPVLVNGKPLKEDLAGTPGIASSH